MLSQQGSRSCQAGK